MAATSLKVTNFKCFGDIPAGFDDVKLVNLIVGRNNSGKSSLLEVVHFATQEKIVVPRNQWHSDSAPKVLLSSLVSEQAAKRVFPEGTSGGVIPGRNHWVFGKQFVGTRITWSTGGARNEFVDLDKCPSGEMPLASVRGGDEYKVRLAQEMANPLKGKVFRQINAERNIIPETDGSFVTELHGGRKVLNVESDGRGATNIIQSYLNKASKASDLVKVELCKVLNDIFHPDAKFTDIVCQQHDDGKWEIFLEESHKGHISLSQSGSGLKTIVLILINTILIPYEVQFDLKNFILACEEIENNLHPSLLRRLVAYMLAFARENGTIFFIATHSNVAIDILSRQLDAQIVHVTHDGRVGRCNAVTTYLDNKAILDDLDVRASDILQSNAIIWVEGPSDRTYINRWIELKMGGKLLEGMHYQCMFYGGRLLAHLSGDDPTAIEEGIAVLRLNRNACMVMDSDKKAAQSRLNDTKKRIEEEFATMGAMSWTTKGREIENYLPGDAISASFKLNNGVAVDQYADFVDWLNSNVDGLGDKYAKKKALFAEKIAPNFDPSTAFDVLDLNERIDALCGAIRRWNNIAEA